MENKVKDHIFGFVYEMALRDAVMRKAYQWSTDDEERGRIFGCKKAKGLTKDYIDALLRGETPDFYKTAAEIEKAFKKVKNSKFTFGNTQKLINMTVKYLYIAAYQDATREDLHKKFKECHCPMDGIMVEKVIAKLKEKNSKEKFIAKLKEKTDVEDVLNTLNEHKNNWRGFLREPWSKISSDKPEQYKLFQEIVKYLCDEENLIPIEYDYKEWNKDSK